MAMPTILLVEDEAAVRKVIAAMLHSLGYTVVEVSDGAEALALFERRNASFDLLVTDVFMPQMSGPALASKLLRLWPQVKVLFMSGYTDGVVVEESAGESAPQPGWQFIEKPFGRGDLAQKVRQALEYKEPSTP